MKNTPRPLPQFPKKKQVYTIYHRLPTRMVRNEINEIISENRNITLFEAKKARTLLLEEWKRILYTFGIPKNYEPPEWLPPERF